MNQRPSAPKADALPLRYIPDVQFRSPQVLKTSTKKRIQAFYLALPADDNPDMPLPFWESLKVGNRDPEQQELEVLGQIPVFDKLPQRALKLIRSLCHVRHFKEGEHVFRTNEPGVGMYIIMEGSVEIYRVRGDSETADRLAEFYDGDFFGELALLEDLPRTASARAQSYSRMIGFFRPDLLTLMNRNPRIASIILLNIARITGRRLIRTNERLEECLMEAGKELN